MHVYIILYRYQIEGEKKPGPVRQYRIYAENLNDARQRAKQYANYPNIEIVDVHPG